jgi:hypothetical protein
MNLSRQKPDACARRNGRWRQPLFVVLLLVCCLILACGRKAPPRAPEDDPAPAVETLGNQLEGDRLTLTVSRTEQTALQQAGYSGFTVFKSIRKISETACRNCPIMFERVAVVSFDRMHRTVPGERIIAYTEKLEKGYRYHYKVNVNLPDGGTGKDSKPIVIQH